jgi:hypothetical protein
LLRIGIQPDFSNQFHLLEVYHTLRKDDAIPPLPKESGLLAQSP